MNKVILLLIFIIAHSTVNAQSWSASIAAGPAIFKDIARADKVSNEKMNALGYDAEISLCYQTTSNWALSFALNRGAYRYKSVYEFINDSPPYTGGRAEEIFTVQAYSLRFNFDYSLLGPKPNQLPRKFNISLGGSVAPGVYREVYRSRNLYAPEEGENKRRPSGALGIFIGIRAQLFYHVNDQWMINLSAASQTDLCRIFNKDGIGTEPDFRSNLLLGAAYRLK